MRAEVDELAELTSEFSSFVLTVDLSTFTEGPSLSPTSRRGVTR